MKPKFTKKHRQFELIYTYTVIYIMVAEKSESKIPAFYGKDEKNFHLWAFRLKTALRARQLISDILNKNVESKLDEKTLSVIVPAVGDSALRAVEECELAKDV